MKPKNDTVVIELGMSRERFEAVKQNFISDLAAVIGVRPEDIEIVSVSDKSCVEHEQSPARGPHVIDWDKVREAIQNMSQEEIDALIQASHGGGKGFEEA